MMVEKTTILFTLTILLSLAIGVISRLKETSLVKNIILGMSVLILLISCIQFFSPSGPLTIESIYSKTPFQINSSSGQPGIIMGFQSTSHDSADIDMVNSTNLNYGVLNVWGNPSYPQLPVLNTASSDGATLFRVDSTGDIEFGRDKEQKGTCIKMYDSVGRIHYLSLNKNGSILISLKTCDPGF
jgi:hypothetical protein